MGHSKGSLHLGRTVGAGDADTPERLEIDSDDLTRHGVIVGMTGSGKTGLGVVLLEEVLSAGIPALIIDPKGDMGNLVLNFPSLRGEDFEPWIDEAAASRDGKSVPEAAADTAAMWKNGLARSGIDGERMEELKSSTDVRIITPGSSAGIPLNLIGDLSPPEGSWDDNSETFRDEIVGLVSGLLVMADLEADPLTSREHILLSNLIEHAWRDGRALDLATLLRQVQEPPIRRLGVFELDAFFPPKDRMKLAMRLNGLLASPSFGEWMEGEPLDIETLLRAPDGRPRASIIYLSHLSDVERQFVVTLILSKFVTWMRGQPGTSELRALIYADEVVGLAPPTAEPPTKGPILTLYKQARAHGVGLVTSTQNPVDLDYKLMSNAVTWMIGRLQTERDKARIIEGLRSASGDIDVGEWGDRIGSLGKREFVLKTSGSPQPSMFGTRWAISYLRGPMTRAELGRLADDRPETVASVTTGSAATTTPVSTEPPAPELADDESTVPPTVASGIPVRYLDPAAPWSRDLDLAPGGTRLAAGLAARVHMLFDERVGDVRHEEEWEAVFFPLDDRFDPDAALTVDYDARDFRDTAPDGAAYVLGGPSLDRAKFFKDAERAIEQQIAREETLKLHRNTKLKVYSRPGESEEDFQKRCLSAAEDRADAEAEKLRDRIESKLKTAEKRLADSERKVRELDTDVGARKQQEMIAGAGEVLSMFLGGRRRVRSLSGMSSRRSQTRRTQERLRSAVEKMEDRQQAIAELEEELEEELVEIWDRWKDVATEIEPFTVPLERTDVALDEIVVFWAPVG